MSLPSHSALNSKATASWQKLLLNCQKLSCRDVCNIWVLTNEIAYGLFVWTYVGVRIIVCLAFSRECFSCHLSVVQKISVKGGIEWCAGLCAVTDLMLRLDALDQWSFCHQSGYCFVLTALSILNVVTAWRKTQPRVNITGCQWRKCATTEIHHTQQSTIERLILLWTEDIIH